MEFTKMTIQSNNPDYSGKWKRNDIEEEMKDLNYPIEVPYDWMIYVLNHAISYGDKDILNMLDIIAKNDLIREIKLKTSMGDWVRIIKE